MLGTDRVKRPGGVVGGKRKGKGCHVFIRSRHDQTKESQLQSVPWLLTSAHFMSGDHGSVT